MSKLRERPDVTWAAVREIDWILGRPPDPTGPTTVITATGGTPVVPPPLTGRVASRCLGVVIIVSAVVYAFAVVSLFVPMSVEAPPTGPPFVVGQLAVGAWFGLVLSRRVLSSTPTAVIGVCAVLAAVIWLVVMFEIEAAVDEATNVRSRSVDAVMGGVGWLPPLVVAAIGPRRTAG